MLVCSCRRRGDPLSSGKFTFALGSTRVFTGRKTEPTPDAAWAPAGSGVAACVWFHSWSAEITCS